MKWHMAPLAVLSLALCGCPSAVLDVPPSPPSETPPVEDRKSVVDANTELGLDLYRHVAADKEGNLFFSPYSVSSALSMTWAGARGDTHKAMGKTLRFGDMPGDRVHPVFQDLLAEQLAEQPFELTVANRLYGQRGYGFEPDYLALTRERYGARLMEVDFEQDPEGAVEDINDWVAAQTHDRIPELLTSVDPSVRLVLLNAIYFKAEWRSKFEEHDSYDRTFHLSGGSEIQSRFMNQTGSYAYADVGDAVLLELPYEGEASMVVVLPKKKDGLSPIEATLTGDRLATWLAKLEPQQVTVSLPKFETTSELSLKEVLSSLGMKVAFTGQADFTGISSRGNLMLEDVIHKAFVKVDEEGTEAAAATAVLVAETAARRAETEFVADHPFLFLIRDTRSGTVLFMGRLADPRS